MQRKGSWGVPEARIELSCGQVEQAPREFLKLLLLGPALDNRPHFLAEEGTAYNGGTVTTRHSRNKSKVAGQPAKVAPVYP
jgi:hypothetical protein